MGITILAAVALLGASVVPAQAEYVDCPQGSYCVWASVSYNGTMAKAAETVRIYSSGSASWKAMDNPGSSVFNNGTKSRVRACTVVQKAGTDSETWGDCFLLSNLKLTLKDGEAVRDPNLTNGAGYGTGALGTNFNNALSSHVWY